MTPLLIDGVMYVSTPSTPRHPELKSSVTALEPETGKVIWKYESPLNIHGRGLAYWRGDASTTPRLFFGVYGGYLAAIDIRTGSLAKGFGQDGYIDAYAGVVSERVAAGWRSSIRFPIQLRFKRTL